MEFVAAGVEVLDSIPESYWNWILKANTKRDYRILCRYLCIPRQP